LPHEKNGDESEGLDFDVLRDSWLVSSVRTSHARTRTCLLLDVLAVNIYDWVRGYIHSFNCWTCLAFMPWTIIPSSLVKIALHICTVGSVYVVECPAISCQPDAPPAHNYDNLHV
jgi:hypothetical protein